jgi:hippurate hydrolase
MRWNVTAAVIWMAAAASTLADGPIQTYDRTDVMPAVDEHIRNSMESWLQLYRELHQYPELSLHESESAGRIASRLEAAGFEVTRGVGGHGVVGMLKNGDGPTILVRGDMDALPITEQTELPYRSQVTVIDPETGLPGGVMHACGHDVHQTCLVGTAEALAKTGANWRGTVVVIAQPAEEIGRGARAMIEDGLFERFPKPDFCLALHVSADFPAGMISYTPGWASANVDSVDIVIHGRGGHGSRPHQTIDPVVAAAHVIVALQTIVARRIDPIEPGVISVGSVHAGSKHNIIADTATLQITVRSYTDETRKALLNGIRDVAVHTCRAMGCRRDPDVTLREDEFTPAGYNDPELTEACAKLFAGLLGEDNVVARKAQMGGEDFGVYAKTLNVPGFMFNLGSIPQARYDASLQPGAGPLPSLHSSTYYPDPEPTIRTGVRCLTAATLSLLRPNS